MGSEEPVAARAHDGRLLSLPTPATHRLASSATCCFPSIQDGCSHGRGLSRVARTPPVCLYRRDPSRVARTLLVLPKPRSAWSRCRPSDQMVEGRCIASQGDQRQPTIAAACTGCRRLRAGSQEPCLCFPNLVMPGPATRRLDRRWGDPVEHCRATISLVETITNV